MNLSNKVVSIVVSKPMPFFAAAENRIFWHFGEILSITV